MTCKNLIEELKKFPSDMEVTWNYDSGYDYPTPVKIYKHDPVYFKEYEFVVLDDDEYADEKESFKEPISRICSAKI